MKRNIMPTIAMLAVGVGLLVAASFASAASSGTDQSASPYVKKGGTLRLSKSTDVDYVDPALAYFSDSFGQIGYATCAKLYSYPDKTGAPGLQVIPEVATGAPIVSKDGKTYTINMKKTYRFHTGAPVTAANFVEAFNRDANPKMQSPATSYMTEIVGAEAVISGKAAKISGIKAVGKYSLQVRLTKSLPDFVARLTMPFFCPVRVGEAIQPDGINNPIGSGPYYVSERVVNRQITLLKNKFYKGPRPANLDKIVWTIGTSLEACRLSTEKNSIDWCVDGIPPATYKDVADRFGVNKPNGQFFFNTALGTSYFALNHDRAAFKGNGQLPLKKAINTAIDRPALVRASGYLGGKRTDQILPPAMTTDVKLYPLNANPARAKTLYGQAANKPDKLVLYTATTGARVVRAQVLQFNLKQIGIDVDIKQYARAVQHEKCATRGEAFDLCDEGWLVDYADPVTFFEPLLNGKNIQQTSNSNESYFNDPRYNARIEQTAALPVGAKRNQQWAALDGDIMKNAVPWAPFLNITIRDFVSSSTGCYLYHPVWEFDLAAACKK
jgi:peptide/nickel transport system substrate-binding protein